MLSIADILNDATKTNQMDEEMRRAAQRAAPYRKKVHRAFSREFVDELSQAEGEIWLLECREHFARGLWLGLRLGQFAEQGPGGGVGDP